MSEFDNCDRCGAAGQVRVVLLSGRVLYFCGHHGREYGPTLLADEAILAYRQDDVALQPV